MSLDASEEEQLHAALLSAFPNLNELQLLTRFDLGKQLDEITGETNRNYATYHLIRWAVAQNCVEDLVLAACRRVPGNQGLRDFADRVLPAVRSRQQLPPLDQQSNDRLPPGETASTLRLIQRGPDGAEIRRFEFRERLVTIGRARKNLVHLPDQDVSWEHGKVELMLGGYYYRHLSATNSTTLRRRGEEGFLFRAGRNDEQLLRNQDRLLIGDNVLAIEFDLIDEDSGYTTTARKPEDIA